MNDLCSGQGSAPQDAFRAKRDAAQAQLARETDGIRKAKRDGHITSAESAGMTEAAHKRYDTAMALARLEGDYPAWETWQGVTGGLLYARRPRTSPPVVVRDVTPAGLRQAIEAAEAERGLR